MNKIQKTILLVEDEVIIAMQEKMALEKYGYNIIIAKAGEEAIKIFGNRHDIDMVLMDIDLGPGIDGTDTAILILKERNIPIIFLSNHTEVEIVEKTEKITSYGFIAKNSGITVLDATIKMAFKLFEAYEALRLRESYLSAIIENQPGLLWLKDLDSRFLSVNKKFAISCNFNDPELLVGKSDFDIWPHNLAQGYVEVDKKVIKSGKPYMVEEQIADQGNIRWFETYKTPIIDKNGAVIGTTGYSNDITERKQTEENLRSLTTKLETLVHFSPLGISLLDLDGKVQLWNPAAEKIFGWTFREIIGRPNPIVPESKQKEYANLSAKVLSGKAVVNLEAVRQRKDGSLVDVSIASAPVYDAAGNLNGRMSIIADNTEHKQSEGKIKKLLEEKELILQEVHHRIKNNMNTIASFSCSRRGP